MQDKLSRAIPYLELLINNKSVKGKKKLIQSFPDFVLDDIVEILYNILFDNVSVRSPRQLKILDRYRRPLTTLFNTYKNKRIRRDLIRRQSGGFIGAVIPLVASVLASTLL